MNENVGGIAPRQFLLAVCLAAPLFSQYPPKTEWRRIRTAHFDVVFPREIETDAGRLANALETLYGPLSQSLGAGLPRHTTVLVPDQDVTRVSGGFVSLFPRLAVMQSMPSQTFWGTNDWINTLTVEEGRHLVQVAKMRHGYGKWMYALFGESGVAAVIGWSLPDWWLSGDSRAAESTLLRGGVGQYASSEMATRALLMSGEKYSYLKAMHGSFTDGTPSQAELGEFLVNHVERTSGPDAWNQIMERAAQTSFNPFAVSMSMKKITGRSAAQNFQETMSQLGETWKASAAGITFSHPIVLNDETRKAFTGYFQPVFAKDGSVLAQKFGLDDYPPQVVRLRPDGTEQRLFRMAPLVSGANRTSAANGRIVWDEYVPDIRWLRGYSEILTRDLNGGHTRRLTHHTRFLNPVLSPDGRRIAVVEFLPNRQSSLVILDSASAAELRRLPSPDNDMLYTPAWSDDGKRLAVVTQSAAGRALTVAEIESGAFHDVIPHRDEEIANPVFNGSYILYKSSRDGIVNIFAVDTASGQCWRVTSSKYGADYPSVSPDGTRLVYSDYTARGYNVAELPLDPKTWTPVDFVAPSATSYQPPVDDYSSRIPSTSYKSERYRPGLNLLDFHSWGPVWTGDQVGFAFYSNDKMGLLDFRAAGLYNVTEAAPGFETNLHYNRFFPVLDFSFADRERNLSYVGYTDHFSERTTSAGFHVPLNLSRGYYSSGASVGVNMEHIGLSGGSLAPLNYGVSLWHIRQRSPRDLAPPWAQVLRFGYSNSVVANHYTANRLFADGRFAVPGLLRHHALVLEGGYQRNNGNYVFSTQILFPRGYTPYTVPNLTKFSGTYSAPLFYPDWSLGRLLYIKRVAADAFYDYGKVQDQHFRSTGVEMIFDVAIAHWPVFRVGVRDAYRIDYRNTRINPFLAFSW